MSIPQDLGADFLWTFDCYDIIDGVETASDLTGDTFLFEIYGLDGTVWIVKTNGSGITVTGNRTVIQFDKAAWTVTNKVFLRGCKYPYKLGQVTAAGFDKPLIAGKIYTT